MNNIILIPGMLGAGCTNVAEILARKLGIQFINTEKIVKKIVIEEKLSFKQLEAMTLSGEINLEELVKSVVLDYLNEGNIIIEGRSAFLILEKKANIKVFLYADEDFRIHRVSERREIPIDEAKEAVRISDEDRSSLVRRLYRKNWLEPTLYDLLINTTNLKFDAIAEIIKTAIENKFKE